MIKCDKIYSTNDKTIKFIFRLDDELIAEVSYINKDDGKDILCVPSHTGCELGCRFCHTSDTSGKVVVRKLYYQEINFMIKEIYEELNLIENNRILLVSYMGCGEPLLNLENILESIRFTTTLCRSRFAISTLLPKNAWCNFFTLTHIVQNENIPLKVHLSLHFTNDQIRQKWMPAALSIESSIAALEFYKKTTNQPVEIHYTLIEDENDSLLDSERLISLLQNRSIPVKLLAYNRRDAIDSAPSTKVDNFRARLNEGGIENEYYDPPGKDVGASCGQFLLEYKKKI